MAWTIATIILVSAAWWSWANLQPSLATHLLLRLLRRFAGFRSQSIEVANEDWPYLVRGRAGGEPVLLIHGFAADKDTWLDYGRKFDTEYRLICPDLPGFGESKARSYDDYSPYAQAKRVLRFLDALGIERCHVAGSSMGGYIATWMTLLAPDRIASLTLMNAAGVSGERPSTMQPLVEAGESPLVATTMAELDHIFSMLSRRPLRLPRFVKRHLLHQYQQNGALWRSIFDQLVRAQQADRIKGRLAEISAPTLVVWGNDDDVLDVSCAQVFVDNIPQAHSLILEEVGHIPMFEAPRRTMRAQTTLMRRQALSS